jgi:hypothetical protein
MGNAVFEKGLIFVCIYLIIWGALTSQINTAFADAWEGVTCPGPDYENGYNETCASFTHADTYADDAFVVWNVSAPWYLNNTGNWVAAIPIGGIVYGMHVVAATLVSFGTAIYAVFTIFVVPELTMYGQTVDASALGWLNGGLFMFGVFGIIALAKGWL